MNELLDLFRRIIGLPVAASSVADDIDALHMFVIGVTMAVSAWVFATITWFVIRYPRRAKGQLTERVVASKRHEALVITAVAVTFIMWWVLGFRQYVRMTAPPPDAMTMYVEAKQWTWKFVDSDGRTTNGVLTVPVGRPVKLVMSSRDVIHSFYVPAFRLKQDVVPGRYTTLWFEAKAPGTYPVFCAEYCGTSHSNMRAEVVVLSADDWARSRERPPEGADERMVAHGREVAMKRGCFACHTLDGQRHVGPTWMGLFGSERVLADGRRVVADEEYLTRSMSEPNADLVAGFPAVMPTYRGSLSPAETGALVALIKSVRNEPGQAMGVPLPKLDVTAEDGGRP